MNVIDETLAAKALSVSDRDAGSGRTAPSATDRGGGGTANLAASPDILSQNLGDLKTRLESLGHGLRLEIDPATRKIQALIVDPKNDRVIRKIPSDEALKLAASLRDVDGHAYLDKAV